MSDSFVMRRVVPHRRMVDGFTPSQRTRALEMMLDDPRTAEAVVTALLLARSSDAVVADRVVPVGG